MADEQTIDIRERIARLEMARESDVSWREQISSDVRAIRTTLDQMSGGKKAMLGLFALFGGVIGIASTIFSTWLGIKSH